MGGYRKVKEETCADVEDVVQRRIGDVCYKKKTETGDDSVFYIFYDNKNKKHRPSWRLMEVKKMIYKNTFGQKENMYLYRFMFNCPSSKGSSCPTKGWREESSQGWISPEMRKEHSRETTR